MSVKWKGAKVLRATRRAQIRGINVTMAAAVRNARAGHGIQTSKRWQSRTFELEDSVKIAIFARKTGRGVSGEWGSVDLVYALVQELGSLKLNIPARPYLRPAADAEYPSLGRNIRRAMA